MYFGRKESIRDIYWIYEQLVLETLKILPNLQMRKLKVNMKVCRYPGELQNMVS